MIWATVSSRSCFCCLYRASPSLAAKNIINLILVLTIWWCPRLESPLVLLAEGVCYDQCVFLAKLSLCPASFHTPRPNFPVTPGVSWLPTFAFQSPIMKRTSFLSVSSRRSCKFSQNRKESWVLKNWVFWTVVLEETLECAWNARRSNQSILKELNPEYSLEGLMLKLKLQYFGHLMQRTDLLEKTLTCWKRPWCWERLRAGGEGDSRGWDG